MGSLILHQAWWCVMNLFKKFVNNIRASAAVELALSFPILIMLCFGGFEMTRYILIQQKISKTVSSMSDLVARSPSISATELTQMFNAVTHLMEPYNDSGDILVIISSVVNYGAGPVVTWQQSGGGTKSAVSQIGVVGGSAVLPDGFTLATNENTIIAEMYYDFNPIVAPDIVATTTVYKRRFNMPRLGSLETLN